MSEDRTLKNLSPAQRRAVESLLTAGNVAAAAVDSGVARSTLYRWLDQPEFVDALRAAESEALTRLSRSLAGLADLATEALRDGLDNAQPINTRLRAAESVLSSLLKVRELVDLEQRITALEGKGNGNS